MMALLKRTSTTWLMRTLGALMVALVALAGVTGQAFAHDDDNTNEVVTYGPNACTVVADLPVYPSATCVKHKSELDDGVTETKNSYVAQGAGDTVDVIRKSFEAAFQAHGWMVVKAEQDPEDQQWEYTIVKPGRQVKVEVEAQEPDEGTGTAISIEEN
jgi:hypothetical protein